jgi:uncharacterized protein YjbI with pentapeptide repeats
MGSNDARRRSIAMDAEQTIEVNGTKRQVRAEDADLSGSSFTDVNLSGATFRNVNFAGAHFEDANLSGWNVRNANFARLRINKADLRGASIVDSLTAGMTIDGIAVAELLAAYRALTARAD